MVAAPARREPNPRPLLYTVLAVALLGDSCAFQQACDPLPDPPSQGEISQRLKDWGQLPEDPEVAQQMVAADAAVLEQQHRASERFKTFNAIFGALLVLAYTFVLVSGTRALRYFPGSAKALSRASLAVLPARVALAAVDLASARAVQPAARELALSYVRAQRATVPPEQYEASERIIGALAPWASPALGVATALFVCVLFQISSRYFARPDVLALFEKRGPPPPEPSPLD